MNTLTYYGTDEKGYRHFLFMELRYRVRPGEELTMNEKEAMERNKNPKEFSYE